MLSRRDYLARLGGIAGLLIPFSTKAKSNALSPSLAAITQIVDTDDRAFIQRAFEMRELAIQAGDQGFGALVVRDNRIIGQAPSRVVVDNDPTAHAEIEAIRDAVRRTGSRDLSGCVLYSSSPACPMCEAAAYWAFIDRMVYGASVVDGGEPSLC